MWRFVFLALTSLLAIAAVPAVTLKTPPPLAERNAALPRIVAPVTLETARVNDALDRLDHRWRHYMAECDESARGQDMEGSTDRSAEVTLNRGGFLSLVIRFDVYCGGAHPSDGGYALVYDLTTGRPVNWIALLGPGLKAHPSGGEDLDGVTVGTVASEPLRALYLARLGDAHDATWRGECGVALADGVLDFILWPDAESRTLQIQAWGLPHVMAGCAEPVGLTVHDLKRLGVDARLVEAIEAH